MSEKTTIKFIGIGAVGRRLVERGSSELCGADHKFLNIGASKEMIVEAASGADILWIVAEAADLKLVAEIGRAACGAQTIALLKGAPDPYILTSFETAVDAYTYASSDDELDNACTAASAISELVNGSGNVNLDMNDVKAIFHRAGRILIGAGEGKDLADAMRTALRSIELYKDRAPSERVICCIETEPDVSLMDLLKSLDIIREASDSDALILWGQVDNPDLHGKARIVIAADFKSISPSC